MTWTLRVTASLLDEMRQDLRRPHHFAAERIGFVYCRPGNQLGSELLVLPSRYVPVDDTHYIRDDEVGARINGDAIRAAMTAALSGVTTVLHVHMHEHRGQPRFSMTDVAEYPRLIQALQNAGPDCPHGALLLSEDRADCLLWMPGQRQPAGSGRVVVVGRPMKFHPGGLYA